MAADQRGADFEKKADKKIAGAGGGCGFFGSSKFEDASDLYQKSANSFKLSKSWSKIRETLKGKAPKKGGKNGDRAGSVYIKLANCHMKLNSMYEAGSACVDAANCYKKTSTTEAVACFNQAVNIFLDNGRLHMAAKYCKEIGELYELEKNYKQAIVYFERSAELFQGEEVTTSANQCKLKVAMFSAQLEQYQKAIENFEEIARHSLNISLLKYGVRGHLLNAGLCQLCKGDVVAINNSLERYQDLDPTFSRTREYKFFACWLNKRNCCSSQDLAAAIDEEDVLKFTNVVKEFDSMTPLDAWKTTLLLRVKEALKAKELEDDDLT
ncbi:unnamed protein product [Camellia sinensis]